MTILITSNMKWSTRWYRGCSCRKTLLHCRGQH